jgi:hypothetical protein
VCRFELKFNTSPIDVCSDRRWVILQEPGDEVITTPARTSRDARDARAAFDDHMASQPQLPKPPLRLACDDESGGEPLRPVALGRA